MEDIMQEFADKHFDEKALKLISNFIKEFDDLFGKYVPKDEVIRRIKENLDTIVLSYKFEKESIKGRFDGDKKEICLKDLDSEEELKSVFFHEMVHCITRNNEKGITGFSRKLHLIDLESTEIVTCHGLTEGFTQYVTQKRDEKYALNLQSAAYPILSEQIGNLVDLIGEDEFLDIAFNRPIELAKKLGFEEEYGVDFDAQEFYEAFDIIWAKEKEIYIAKFKKETPEAKLMKAIFGEDYTIEDDGGEEIKPYKKLIVDTFKKIMLSRPITTVEEFNVAYWRISSYAEQLNMPKDVELYKDLLAQIENLCKSGKSMEEMLEEMTEEARILVKGNQIVQEFNQLSKEERIELLTQKSFFEKLTEEKIFDSEFKMSILSQISRGIIKTDSQDRDYNLFWHLIDGLAQIIKDRGYNVDTLSLEYIDFEKTYGTTVFNLYNTTIEDSTYLGTFIEGESDFTELTIYDSERERIVVEYPELSDAIFLSTKCGEMLAYNGNEEYILIDKTGRMKTSNKITYCASELELMQQSLKERLRNLQQFIKMRAPEGIIANSKRLVQERMAEIQQIQNKSKILPEEIEQVTADVSVEEMEQIMGDITHSKEKRQEALEKGIGYEK